MFTFIGGPFWVKIIKKSNLSFHSVTKAFTGDTMYNHIAYFEYMQNSNILAVVDGRTCLIKVDDNVTVVELCVWITGKSNKQQR